MFYVDLDYLKKVGLYFDENFGTIRVRKSSYRYPTLSCRLEDDGNNENNIASNLVFVLSYFISDDYNKQQIEFTLSDWQQFGKDCEVFKVLKTSQFFRYFSVTNDLVMNVYKSRLKGRKAWKKRNWKLPFRNAKVLEAFGITKELRSVTNANSFDAVKIVEDIVELDEIMKQCIAKAAKDFSYMPFDLFFDCYKKKLALQKKIGRAKGTDETETGVFVPSRTNRDKVFKEFAKQVVLLQKNG